MLPVTIIKTIIKNKKILVSAGSSPTGGLMYFFLNPAIFLKIQCTIE